MSLVVTLKAIVNIYCYFPNSWIGLDVTGMVILLCNRCIDHCCYSSNPFAQRVDFNWSCYISDYLVEIFILCSVGGWLHSRIIIVPTSPIHRSVGGSTSLIVVMGESNLFLGCSFVLQYLDFLISYLLSAETGSVTIGLTISTKPCSILSFFLVRVNRFLISFWSVYSVFLQLSSQLF